MHRFVLVALLLPMLGVSNFGTSKLFNGGGGGGGGRGAVVSGASTTVNAGGVSPLTDWDSSFASTADLGCCTASDCQLSNGGSTYQRWTPTALREATDLTYSFGSYEAVAVPMFPVVTTSVSSSCLNVTVGDGKHTNNNVNAWLTAVDQAQGYQEVRYDLIYREQLLARHPDLGAFDPDWILRTTRTWADFVGFFDLNPMRAADQTRCAADGSTCDWSNMRSPDESFNAAHAWDSGDGSEDGHTLYDTLAIMDPGLEQTAVYRFFNRGGDPQQMFSPVGVVADVSDANYRAWLIDYYQLLLAARPLAAGLSLIHKLHFFRQSDGGVAQHWVDVGDGLSGILAEDCSGVTGTADTLAELQLCDDADSGPPKDAAGNDYLYADEVDGMVNLARELNTAGIPFLMRSANPYWWIGCTTLSGGWSGTDCTNTYGATEAPKLREFASRATVLNIDRAGKPSDGGNGGLGSGSGTGFSCASLEALIMSAPGQKPTTINCIDSQKPLRTAPSVHTLPESTNPEILTPDSTECDDGIDNDGDGLTDYPADVSCSSASDLFEYGASQCDNNVDDDSDGDIDYPDDVGCSALTDDDEADPVAGVGASMVATTMQGSTCVAPCVVHFDASATTADSYSREFHTLKYRWDFDDVGSGTWSTGASGGASRNAGEGAIQAHVYYTAGTYDPILTATDPAGTSDTDTTTITVTNPDTHFAGTATVCIGNVLPTAGAGGCPTGAAVVSNSDLDDALSDTTTGDGGGVNGGCDANGGKVRCLFNGGDTFTSSASVTLATGAGPGVIASYGTGDAIFEGPGGSTSIAVLPPGWTVYNVTVHANNASTSPLAIPVTIDATQGVSVVGAIADELGNYFVSTGGIADGGSPYNFALVDSTTDAVSGFSGDPGALFLRHNNIVVMGNALTSPEYLTRTVHVSKALFAHNTYSTNNTTGIQNNFQLRSCDSTGVTCGGITQRSRWVWIADNLFKQTLAGNFPAIRISDNSTAATTGTGNGGVSDIVIERNFQIVDGSYGDTGVGGLVGYQIGADVTVRNNVVDYQGAAGTGTMRFINPASSNGITQSNVEVYNNTVYVDDASTGGVTFCDGGDNLATSSCSGNLLYAPNRSGTKTFSSGAGWTSVADNVNATADPFASAPAGQGLTTIDDFAVSAAGQADGTGYDFSGVDTFNLLDTDGCLRSAPWDAGAWQIGAGSCLP